MPHRRKGHAAQSTGKAEREQRDRAATERAQAGLLSNRSSSSPAPWLQGLPIPGATDAAAEARREAEKAASLEQVAEHGARLRRQEEERIQSEAHKMELLRLAKEIQRGD